MLKTNITVENEFLSFISEAIQEKYNISSLMAENMVQNSNIAKMIYKSPDFVMHYDVEDLADEIMNDIMAR